MRRQGQREALRPVHLRGLQELLQALRPAQPELHLPRQPPVPCGPAPPQPVPALPPHQVPQGRHAPRRWVAGGESGQRAPRRTPGPRTSRPALLSPAPTRPSPRSSLASSPPPVELVPLLCSGFQVPPAPLPPPSPLQARPSVARPRRLWQAASGALPRLFCASLLVLWDGPLPPPPMRLAPGCSLSDVLSLWPDSVSLSPCSSSSGRSASLAGPGSVWTPSRPRFLPLQEGDSGTQCPDPWLVPLPPAASPFIVLLPRSSCPSLASPLAVLVFPSPALFFRRPACLPALLPCPERFRQEVPGI